MAGDLTGRIGVLGGSFNPLHLGHLILAQTALESLDLSRVLFVPSARPPHKSPAALAEAHHRLAMVKAAIECNPAFDVSEIELRRPGPSFTVDTLAELRRENPGLELCFIIGADTLSELHLWKDIDRLLTLCRVVTFARPGVESERVMHTDLHLPPPWPERLRADVRAGRRIEISSSEIRHRVAEGLSIRYLVPPEVEMYIADQKLYTG